MASLRRPMWAGSSIPARHGSPSSRCITTKPASTRPRWAGSCRPIPRGMTMGRTGMIMSGGDPINGVDPSGLCTGSLISNDNGTCKGSSLTGAGAVNPGLNGAGSSTGEVPGAGKGAGSAQGTTAPQGSQTSQFQTAFLDTSTVASAASETLGALKGGVLGASCLLTSGSCGLVQQRQIFYHYGLAANARFFASGFRSGGYLTTTPLYSAKDAQSYLALPQKPDAFYKVSLQVGFPKFGPYTVQPNYGQPGGGIEYITLASSPPGSVTGPYRLRP
jgi:hypothetical protein